MDELQAKVDEGVEDIENCDGAKVDDLSGVREVETMFLFGESFGRRRVSVLLRKISLKPLET